MCHLPSILFGPHRQAIALSVICRKLTILQTQYPFLDFFVCCILQPFACGMIQAHLLISLCVSQDDLLSLIQPGLSPAQQYFSPSLSANAKTQPVYVPKHAERPRGPQWTSQLADVKFLESQAEVPSLSNGTAASKTDATTVKETSVPRMAEALKQVGLRAACWALCASVPPPPRSMTQILDPILGNLDYCPQTDLAHVMFIHLWLFQLNVLVEVLQPCWLLLPPGSFGPLGGCPVSSNCAPFRVLFLATLHHNEISCAVVGGVVACGWRRLCP